MLTLDTLLAKAGISKWDGITWFSCCRFDGQNLICGNEDDMKTIVRCFLPELQCVQDGIRVVYAATLGNPSPPRPAKHAFKKSYYVAQNLLD